MSRVDSNTYLPLVLSQVRRLLSRMDRERPSKTYGSFDRTFWAWKFTDFAGARFQEALYALSWLYCHAVPGNELFDKPKVLEWIVAGFRNWRSLQYGDGSFDEAYPFEHSLAATAFTSFYLGEALLVVGDRFPGAEYAATVETFRRAGDWLCENDEHHGVLSNHLAVAAAALVVIGQITGIDKYAVRSQHFIKRIMECQSSEGWYEEYGGADIGYQTHGTFYLARVWSLTGDEVLLESLKRSVKFLSYFIHPNGTLGGEYSSRNTSFYFPAGFEILAPVCPDAAAISKYMRSSVADQNAAGLAMMDAYNFCPLLNNYLFAHDVSQDLQNAGELPCCQPGHWEFPGAGLVLHSTASYLAIFAPSKGGVLKIYDKVRGQLALSDCGYWVQLGGGGRASNQGFSLDYYMEMSSRGAFVRAPFVLMNQKVMNPWLFIAFRLFTLTIGRFKMVARRVKLLLVQVLVSRKKQVDINLERKVDFFPDEVRIADKIIDNESGNDAKTFYLGSKFSSIHMGSARYFQMDELDSPDLEAIAPLSRTFTWKSMK